MREERCQISKGKTHGRNFQAVFFFFSFFLAFLFFFCTSALRGREKDALSCSCPRVVTALY